MTGAPLGKWLLENPKKFDHLQTATSEWKVLAPFARTSTKWRELDSGDVLKGLQFAMGHGLEQELASPSPKSVAKDLATVAEAFDVEGGAPKVAEAIDLEICHVRLGSALRGHAVESADALATVPTDSRPKLYAIAKEYTSKTKSTVVHPAMDFIMKEFAPAEATPALAAEAVEGDSGAEPAAAPSAGPHRPCRGGGRRREAFCQV